MYGNRLDLDKKQACFPGRPRTLTPNYTYILAKSNPLEQSTFEVSTPLCFLLASQSVTVYPGGSFKQDRVQTAEVSLDHIRNTGKSRTQKRPIACLRYSEKHEAYKSDLF